MTDLKPEERILEGALDVVMEKTISGTRMHLIAEEVNMVQSNLHYYYKTKEDLMLALQNKVLRKCLEIREEDKLLAEDNLESQLEIFINQKRQFILGHQKYDFAEVDFWVQARNNVNFKKAFIESFEGWRNDISEVISNYTDDISEKKLKYIPYVMVSMLEGATMQYLIDEGSFDINEYFEFCKRNIIRMIEQ